MSETFEIANSQADVKICFLFLIMQMQRKKFQIYDIIIDVNYLGGVIWLLNRIVGQLELLVLELVN